jgi:hypothetical protein
MMYAQTQRITDSAYRRTLIRCLDDPIIMDDDEAAQPRLCSKKRDEAKPENRSGTPDLSRSCEGASARQRPVRAAHAEFVAALAGHPPRPIPLEADALDLEDRADHLNKVLSALSVYLALILDDTAQHVPGSLDLRDAEGLLADLTSDMTGAIQHAADDMAGRPA